MLTTRVRRRKINIGGIFMQHGLKRDERGLTLMELIIVLAVIAIIGAILAPNFLSATDKARLKSDIESAGVIQTAIDTYNAEQSTPIASSDTMANIIKTLKDNGYLSAAADSLPQTDKAVWVYGAEGVVKLNIYECQPKIKGDVYNSLTAKEQSAVSLTQ